MRAFCTVSAPLEVCASSAEQLSPGSRFLALRLLGNQQPKTLYFLVDAKSRVREVYTQTCLHFATHGMLDTELFGLAVLIDGEYMFADPESKLSKYGPKSWRSSHTHGLDANGRPLLELHFRVQFYIESPILLKDETSRHNYYLQLKYNTLQRDIPREYSEQSMILLAGLALQADLGDAPITSNSTATNGNNDDGGSDGGSDETAPTSMASKVMGRGAAGSKASGATATLPKINKRSASSAANTERVLRLSTYASGAPTTSAAATGPVFPNPSGSLKRGLASVAASLTPSSSSLSISRSVKSSNPGQALSPTTSGPGSNSSSSVSSAGSASTSSSPPDYFRLDDYLPPGLRTPWAVSALKACHRENRGMSAADAELHYIQQACVVLQESINAHTYRMRLSKSETGPGNSWFVVYAKGIKIFGVGDNPQQQITFLWPNITKLSFERKKFEIRSGDSKITLYAGSDEKNKMLLTLCKETHQFSMKIAARLKEVIKREEEETNCLHACYIYSRSLHLPYKNKGDQRISVISSTSSNTTSGIVSDRVHSEDELEIMINTPPAPLAAPSTESLALAHLLDRPSVSRQNSSVGQVSLKELEEQLAALTARQSQQQGPQKQRRNSNERGASESSAADLSHSLSSGNNSSQCSGSTSNPQLNEDSSTTTSTTTTPSTTNTDSPNSQHKIGSQCSSTCSTVVVTASSALDASPLASLGRSNATPPQRRNSTSSSLELGFSHTAQNSTLSEAESSCHGHDFTSSTRDDTESVSGVYTLAHGAPPTETSGVYTMQGSELTGHSSEIAESEKSSHYGLFPAAKSEISDDHLLSEMPNLDLVDGGSGYHGNRIKTQDFRLRSDSNVSTSGSFRGDGSDPTDNKHTLLSAEELTELIVGRGTYPNRKTVSSSLDTDCDYVTLPLSLAGESYIPGHQDTAPSEEDQVEDLINDLLPTDPPAPPQRIDSNGLGAHHQQLASLSNIRMRSPPPYNARHEKTGLCGPPVRQVKASNNAATTAATPPPPPHPAAAPPPPPPHPAAALPPPPPHPAVAVVAPKVPTPPKGAEQKAAVAAVKAAAPPLPPPAAAPPAPVAAPAVRRRDPPPYPAGAKPRPTSLISVASSSTASAPAGIALANGATVCRAASGSMTSLKSEEVTARFITTRPQISILKAHTSIVNDNPPKPSYAAPTTSSSAASSVGSVSGGHHHMVPPPPHHHLSQHSVHNSNYMGGSQASLSLGHSQASLSAATVAHAAGVIPSSIGIPIVPYTLHGGNHKPSLSHVQPPPPQTPYAEMKPPPPRTCVLLPVIKPRQFLPPPPPSLPRQPPPPPPTQLAGMYTTQLARKQLELYQQQLYSDVDYVIYPIQDPAVSQQEYLDAKQGSILAAMAQAPPGPPPHPYLAAYHTAGGWDTCKGHAIYRSTPYLPLALSTHSRYASTQNLSDTYVQLPSAYSPLYSPSMASLCSSYEPPPPPAPLHSAALAAAAAANSSNFFGARSRSDDNILNSLEALPKMKRMPPPPPPPPYVNRHLKKPPMPTPSEKPPPIPSKPAPSSAMSGGCTYNNQSKQHSPMRSSVLPPRKPPTLSNSGSHMSKTSSGAQWAGERPKPDLGLGKSNTSILAHLQASIAEANRQAAKTNPLATGQPAASSYNNMPGPPNSQLDIALLREKSKNLDLPLISALCNDRSLIKQTKLHVHPKHSRNSSSSAVTSLSTAGCTPSGTASSSNSSGSAGTPPTSAHSSPGSASQMHAASKSMAAIIPSTSNATTTAPNTPTMNGASAAALAAKQAAAAAGGKSRKTSISHRHPNDKLPPLPMQLAEANNYVMDPAILKHHKNYNAQS